MPKKCSMPFFAKNKKGQQRLAPCGKCEVCRRRHISAWSFRLMQERKNAISAHFITLTYNDNHQPITANGYRSLKKRDLQLFFKRLRKAHPEAKRCAETPIKYFAVGEYGGKIGRPHYHVILFNADRKKIQQAWSSCRYDRYVTYTKRIRANGTFYRVNYRKVWNHMGHVHYGDRRGVSEAAAGYTLKYILKPKDHWEWSDDDSEREFAVISQGIGRSYINRKNVGWHRSDLNNRMYCNIELGKKIAMPRYYKDRIYSEAERESIGEHSRLKFAEEILNDLLSLYKNDPDYVSSYHKKIEQEKAAVDASYYKLQKQSKHVQSKIGTNGTRRRNNGRRVKRRSSTGRDICTFTNNKKYVQRAVLPKEVRREYATLSDRP